jgi:hypothetical protein
MLSRRQIGRISNAFEHGNDLTKHISMIENEIEPLQSRVDEVIRSTDFAAAAALLEDGMNAYLSAINLLRSDVWRHSPVTGLPFGKLSSGMSSLRVSHCWKSRAGMLSPSTKILVLAPGSGHLRSTRMLINSNNRAA